MFRIIALLVGVFLLSAAFSGDSSPATEDSHATAGVASFLGECPPLKPGQSDPVAGKKCIRELQTVLRDLGYDQRLTGNFAQSTEANVKDFQRRHKIEAVGLVGQKTRAALLRDSSSSAPSIRDVPQPDYPTNTCTSQQCDLYLRRTTTRQYAHLIGDRPVATIAVSTAILRTACARGFKLSIPAIACGVVADHYAGQVKSALADAARQQACLHITLEVPDTLRSPIIFGTDNSTRCKQ